MYVIASSHSLNMMYINLEDQVKSSFLYHHQQISIYLSIYTISHNSTYKIKLPKLPTF